jgi:hypothetical protein
LDAAIDAMGQGDRGGKVTAIDLEDPCNRSAVMLIGFIVAIFAANFAIGAVSSSAHFFTPFLLCFRLHDKQDVFCDRLWVHDLPQVR